MADQPPYDHVLNRQGLQFEQYAYTNQPKLIEALDQHPEIKARRAALDQSVKAKSSRAEKKTRKLLVIAAHNDENDDDDVRMDLRVNETSHPHLIAPGIDIAGKLTAEQKTANRRHARLCAINEMAVGKEHDLVPDVRCPSAFDRVVFEGDVAAMLDQVGFEKGKTVKSGTNHAKNLPKFSSNGNRKRLTVPEPGTEDSGAQMEAWLADMKYPDLAFGEKVDKHHT